MILFFQQLHQLAVDLVLVVTVVMVELVVLAVELVQLDAAGTRTASPVQGFAGGRC
jgi:hypothetical protein